MIALLLLIAFVSVNNPTPQTCGTVNQREVALNATTREGGIVDSLRAEDLVVFHDGHAARILKLERNTNPVAVAILIDTSASQQRTLNGTKLAATKFVESVLSSSKDRAALVSFAETATIEQDLTSNLGLVQSALARARFINPFLNGVISGPPSNKQPMPGSTAIWDAIWATVEDITAASGERRLVILLTDGQDTSSRMNLRETIEHAAANQVTVFPIGIADNQDYGSVDEGALKKLAEGTGGRAFFPRKISDLDGIFSQITKAIESDYSLTYCAATASSNKPKKVALHLANRQLQQSKLQLAFPQFAF
jgi:VWFA-related protein